MCAPTNFHHVLIKLINLLPSLKRILKSINNWEIEIQFRNHKIISNHFERVNRGHLNQVQGSDQIYTCDPKCTAFLRGVFVVATRFNQSAPPHSRLCLSSRRPAEIPQLYPVYKTYFMVEKLVKELVMKDDVGANYCYMLFI